MIKKWYKGLSKNQSKLIKSMTSSNGPLARVDLSMYYSSVNTCQNQVKLCTTKVWDDVQLAIGKFCFSIKDCRSQWFYNKGSRTENIGLRTKFFRLLWETLFCPLVPKFQFILMSNCWVIIHFMIYIEGGPGTDIIDMTTNFFQRSLA